MQNAALSDAESAGIYSFLYVLLGRPAFFTHTLLRKLAHFAEYALLGLHGPLYALLWRKGWIVPLFGPLCAAIDEGIQYFVPGRAAAFTDVLIDTCGFAVGAMLMLLALWILKRKGRT